MIKEYGIKDWNSFIQTICEIANHHQWLVSVVSRVALPIRQAKQQ